MQPHFGFRSKLPHRGYKTKKRLQIFAMHTAKAVFYLIISPLKKNEMPLHNQPDGIIVKKMIIFVYNMVIITQLLTWCKRNFP
ncbi:MAG: hypothetical protein A2X01_18810 [Bacteroidetes bacterium GWF2_35_48]|nr:MAG: hypothetical protein A2X01_18810 [Bacteroidetes bacterium GWF2_35_48]